MLPIQNEVIALSTKEDGDFHSQELKGEEVAILGVWSIKHLGMLADPSDIVPEQLLRRAPDTYLLPALEEEFVWVSPVLHGITNEWEPMPDNWR